MNTKKGKLQNFRAPLQSVNHHQMTVTQRIRLVEILMPQRMLSFWFMIILSKMFYDTLQCVIFSKFTMQKNWPKTTAFHFVFLLFQNPLIVQKSGLKHHSFLICFTETWKPRNTAHPLINVRYWSSNINISDSIKHTVHMVVIGKPFFLRWLDTPN